MARPPAPRPAEPRASRLARGLRPWAALALAALVGVAGTRPAGAAITVAFSPQSPTVTPGSEFTLEVRVTEAGTEFNAFDLVVRYDPAALTFVPSSPQEGAYMTGACGATFHVFSAAGDSLEVNESLLCSGLSLPGPGTVYALRFQASNTPQTTVVRFRTARFFDAGVIVGPVVATDDTIAITPPADVAPAPASAALALRAWPVPARGALTLAVANPRAGAQRLDVLDLGGRRVRALERGTFAAGERRVAWDGRDDAGRPLPPGVYRVVLAAGADVAVTRVTLLR